MQTKINPKLAQLCEEIHKLTWVNPEGLRVLSFDQVRDLLSRKLGGLDEFEVYQMSVKRRRTKKIQRFNTNDIRKTL